MNVLFFGKAANLTTWEQRDFWPGSDAGPDASCNEDTYEKSIGSEASGAPQEDGLFRNAATKIMAYRIFPQSLVSGVLRHEPVAVGDTVGIDYRVMPGLHLFFCARVVEVFDGEYDGMWRAGFRYRTLVGHPEFGAETFCVEKKMESGEVTVALRSWSRPGTRLAKLGAPLVRLAQIHASKAALRELSR